MTSYEYFAMNIYHEKFSNSCSIISSIKLFIDIFGEKGRGARSAVGMSSLPFNIPVEVEITIKILAE